MSNRKWKMENGETFMYLSARTLPVTHGLLTCLALALLGVIASAQDTGASAKTPTLFLIGDSTVRNGAGDGANKQWGWGEPIAAYFDQTKIAVLNRARGGRSSRTFVTEGLWEQVLSAMKPGDFVLIQFGHNDGGPINDTSRARGTIKGVGEESEEIDNLLTKKHEVVHSYGWYLRKYIADTKARCVVEGIKANNLSVAKFLRKDVMAFDPSRPDPPENFKIPASPPRSEVKPTGN